MKRSPAVTEACRGGVWCRSGSSGHLPSCLLGFRSSAKTNKGSQYVNRVSGRMKMRYVTPDTQGMVKEGGACFRFLWLSAEKPQGAEQTFEGHYGNPYAPRYTGHLNKFHVNDNFHSAALKLFKNMNRNSFGTNTKQFYLLITAMNTMPSFKGLQAPMGRSIRPYR